MSAIRWMALLLGMAFSSIAGAQLDAFLMYSKAGEKDGKKQYVTETRIAKCTEIKANEVRCVLSDAKPQSFEPYRATQLPEPVTFIHFGNPCFCKVDGYGRLICTPPNCR